MTPNEAATREHEPSGRQTSRVDLGRAAAGERTAVTRWWRSRYGARILREVAVVAALLTLYRLGRTFGRDEVERGFSNARQVLGFERSLGIDTERSWQHVALQHPGIVRLLNRYYASVHFPASIAFLALMYVRAPQLVVRVRFLFATVTGTALVIHLVYPLAPPRMLDGYVDTIARWGPAIYERSDVASVANQYAAMPSLHFAWSVLVAYGLVAALRTRWRWLAVLHPTVTLAAIVLTANHYWLDAIVALGLVGAAAAAESWRHRPTDADAAPSTAESGGTRPPGPEGPDGELVADRR